MTFEIEEPGFHVFEIWMREDGVIVDDVVISQDMDLTDAALNGTPYSSRYFENPPNAAPIAAADSLVILEGGPAVMFDPLANDQDPDGDPLTLLAASSPEYGMVDLLDGQAVYTLNQNHPVWSTLDKGVMLFDNFDYLVGDGNGGEALGHVSISIVGISSGDISDQLSALGYSGLELTLAYDSELDAAAPGTYTYEVEPRNEDLARARVTLHLSQDLIEAIQTGQDPRFLLDLIGAPEPVENPTPEIPEEEPGFPGDFAFEMTTLETGYRHVKLIWMDNVGWSSPWLIQRSTTSSFVDPVNLVDNQTADNSGEGSFRWLGINADNYVDIDGLEENTTYYYRVATCLNLSDYYQQGANPQFSSWIYGKATTGSLASAKKQVYNVRNFGAIPGDGQNDYPAVLSALAAAESAGGGVVYLPAGSYDLWPTDSTVKVVGGLPTLQVGKSATSCMFNVKSDNITFLGETNENGPTSYMNFYLWEKIPATKYLSIRDINGTELQVRRYALFQPGNVSEITFKNLNIDMGAVPV
ncbi:MAG: hypothetical protein KJT03_21220, partial [Verrucomicrobiae bacterium]|nr:hypothetical protein [Verrucomicrobiae bacterium]